MSDAPVQSHPPSEVAVSDPEVQDTDTVLVSACSSRRASQVSISPDEDDDKKEAMAAVGISATTPTFSNLLKRVSGRTVVSNDMPKCVNETQGLLEAGLRYAHKGSDDSESIVAQASTLRQFSQFLEEADEVDDITLRARVWRSFLQFCYAVTLGTFVGLVTVIFHAGVAKLEEYHRLGATSLSEKIPWSADKCLRGVSVLSSCPGISFSIFMTLGTTLSSFGTSWICQRKVPECIGGGTIATKICLAVGSPIPLRVGICRLVLSTIYVGSGNALGIEAPTLHICAAIASSLHGLASRSSDCINRCFPKSEPIPPLFERDGLPQAVVLGCAAGLSAAFGSPLAGITYAVEEYVDVRQTGVVTSLVLMSSVSATLVRNFLQTYIGDGGLSISTQNAQTSAQSSGYTVRDASDYQATMSWMMFAIAIGTLLGLFSPILMSGVLRMRSKFHGWSPGCEIFMSSMGGLAAGLLGSVAYFLTSCSTSWGFGDLSQVLDVHGMCNLPSGASSMQEVCVLLILSVAKLLAFLMCFALGGSGGALMPSLFIGALLGRSIGHAFAYFDSSFPHAGAILGMAAFFSANMRLPLTGATVVLEFAMQVESHYDAHLLCMIPLSAALGTWIASTCDPLSVHEQMMLQDGIDPLTLSQQIQFMMRGNDAENVSEEKTDTHVRSGSLASGESRISRLSLTGVANTDNAASMRMLAAAQRRSVMPDSRGVFSSRSSHGHDGTRSVISVPDDLLYASHLRLPLRQVRLERFFPRVAATFKRLKTPSMQNTLRSTTDSMKGPGRHASKNSITSCRVDGGSVLSCLPEDGTPDGLRQSQMTTRNLARTQAKGRASVAPSCGLFGNPGRHLSGATNSSCPSSGSFFSTSSPHRASSMGASTMGTSTDFQGCIPNPRLLGRGHANAKIRNEHEETPNKQALPGSFFRSFWRGSSICEVQGYGEKDELPNANSQPHSRRSSTEVLD